ncbi:MAG: Transcriptional regulator, MarR family [uncultured Rubrobacteraceae bacterium]|uniref:Transcriptional regulator, MarR family n=1 Tax=uncultured Rubrobacteraceae bacterium TaxID=349277 RepID=A0A6J4PL55_9ACTN|nr:MAG: Transcriptional regulator, MarR family [uncultured Rubrobacteraceae bacterium]
MDKWTAEGDAFGKIILEVFRLNGRLIDAGDGIAAPVGQTSARWQVLGVVSGGPASVAQVARAMGLARQSVQRTADLLAADGLVRYADNPHHRRAKLVMMTPKGQQTLDYIGRRQVRWANRIGGGHDLEQLRTAAAVLRQLRESLEQDEQDSGPSASSDV